MAPQGRKRSSKAGLPPGSLVYIGERKQEKVRIQLVDYDETRFEEREIDKVQECFAFAQTPNVTWLNVVGLHQVELLEALGKCYGLHPLVLEDILNTEQRPKMDDFGDYVYVVLRVLSHRGDGLEIESEQVSIVLGGSFVISFQERESNCFNPVRERLRSSKGRIRKMGAGYLVYSLLDAIVDNYFLVVEELGEKIEMIEEALVTNPKPETLTAIHRLKQRMIVLHRSVWPLREVVNALARGESPLVGEGTGVYLRDVYDHVIQVIDTLETYRDMISGMLDIYLSSISNRLNEVMKVLTIIGTIFIPLTFLVGVYGMNFKYMPELESHWGYPILWLVMAAVGVFMLIMFRRKKWL